MFLSEKTNSLFFTDSGPLGESSLENPSGSLFVIDLHVSMLKPIIYGSLAHPAGLAMNQDQSILYVSGVFHTSVFHQFSGRLGPTALAMNIQKKELFVARYDFAETSKDGLITVLNEQGDFDRDLLVKDYPELTGLWFSTLPNKKDNLYATESSTNSFLQINTADED
jgi:hypothetical protein